MLTDQIVSCVACAILLCIHVTYARNDVYIMKSNQQVKVTKSLTRCTSTHGSSDDLLTSADKDGCQLKVKIVLNISDSSRIINGDPLIVVDKAYDRISDRYVRILYPIVLKFRVEEILKWYGLNFWHVVNGNAWEEVINKESKNYTGCSDNTALPTCGMFARNNEYVQSSQGFCCSCDPQINEHRQPQELPRYYFEEWQNRRKRNSGKHVRGGQNCNDKFTPPHVNQTSYHESAHCLRFSDIWYSVYSLNPPKLYQNVHLQLFQKTVSASKAVKWTDLVKGHMVNVGTYKPSFIDEQHRFAFKYNLVQDEVDDPMQLNYRGMLLLVPQSLSPSKGEQATSKFTDPVQYLLLKESLVTSNTDECDKAGVGFTAFANQPQRCALPRGTCLKNQPIELWKMDIESWQKGEKGKYILENYGKLPVKPFRENQVSGEQGLTLKYEKPHDISITAEIRLSPKSLVDLVNNQGQLSEIHVDSTSPNQTIITVLFKNVDPTSYNFTSKLTDCPKNLPPTWSNVSTSYMDAPPYKTTEFRIKIDGVISLERFHCTLHISNFNQNVIAKRSVLIHRFDRCYCLYHCQCTCLDLIPGLQCAPLALAHYKAAGFFGIPPPLVKDLHGKTKKKLSYLLIIFVATFLFLFFLGFMKGILGIFLCPSVGFCGLHFLLPPPKKMDTYYEDELRNRSIIYDSNGFPIHPDTRQPTLFTKKSKHFCLNVFFFFISPILMTWKLFKICFNFLCRNKSKEKSPLQTDSKPKRESHFDDGEGKEATEETKLLDKENIPGHLQNPSMVKENLIQNIKAPLQSRSYKRQNITDDKKSSDQIDHEHPYRSEKPSYKTQSVVLSISRNNDAKRELDLTVDDILKMKNSSIESIKTLKRTTKIFENTDISYSDMDDKYPFSRSPSIGITGKYLNQSSSTSLESVVEPAKMAYKQSSARILPPQMSYKQSMPPRILYKLGNMPEALKETHDRPKRMKPEASTSNTSEDITNSSEEANIFVRNLLKSNVVFRNLMEPIGGVSSLKGELYSIKGHLRKTEDGYTFFPTYPRQYWFVDNGKMIKLLDPLDLDKEALKKTYENDESVFNGKEISVKPRGALINVPNFYDEKI